MRDVLENLFENIKNDLCNLLNDPETPDEVFSTLEVSERIDEAMKLLFPKNKCACTIVCIEDNFGYHVYDEWRGLGYRYNHILKGDLVKIILSVDGTIWYGNTFSTNPDDIKKEQETQRITDALAKIEDAIIDNLKSSTDLVLTSDDIVSVVTDQTLKHGLESVRNCISYQVGGNPLLETKYLVFNHASLINKCTETYDSECLPNTCFELIPGEKYNIDLSVTIEEEVTRFTTQSAHIYRILPVTNGMSQLRLQSSKQFYSETRKNHGICAFRVTSKDARTKIGLSDTLSKGLVETLPNRLAGSAVYTRCFTLEIPQ
jgi:hypothetical protein